MKRFYLLVLLLVIVLGLHAQVPSITWANGIGGTEDDLIQAIAVDASGNVYIAGSHTGHIDFDPGAGTAIVDSNAGSADAFIAKYSSAGVFQWLNAVGSPLADEALSIVVDGTSVYVAGYYSGLIDFDDTAGNTVYDTKGGADIFIAKYATSNGALSWAYGFGAEDDDYATGVSFDASGNVYMSANFHGTVDFNPSLVTATPKTSWGEYDMALARYSSAGTLDWVITLGSIEDDFATSCFVNGSNVFITGNYLDTFHADPNLTTTTAPNGGGTDGYFGQYAASTGSLIWGGWISSSSDDGVSSVWADASYLYTAGFFGGTATVIGDLGSSTNLVSNGFTDAYMARHQLSNHTVSWANKIGGADTDFINVMTSDGSSLYITGAYAATIDMDPSAGTANLTNAGDYDVMYGKYAASNGAHLASFGAGQTFEEQGTSVAVDASSNVYLAGVFSDAIDLDAIGNTAVKTAAGPRDGFFAKYSQSSEPTAQPTNPVFSSITGYGFNLAFTAAIGNPAGYLVLIRSGGAPTGIPVDGTTYNAGDLIGNGFVLFTPAASTSYTTSALSANTTYQLAIFSYNGSGANINYRTVSPLPGTATTLSQSAEPTASPAGFVSSNITTTGYTVSYTAAAGATGYIAVRQTGSAPIFGPADGTVYTAGTTIGSGTDKVAYVGSALTFNETGLSVATTYQYKIYAYSGASTAINYRQTSPLPGTVTTGGSLEPTAQPTNLVFSNIATTSFDFDFTASAGSNVAGVIGFYKIGSAPSFVPQPGVDYAVNSVQGDATVSFKGTGTDWTFSSATANTTYHFALYAYNGSGTSINYRQLNPLRNSVTTLDPNADTTPPVVTDLTQTRTPPNTAVKVTVTVTDNLSGVSDVYVTYYPISSDREGTGTLVLKGGTTNTYEYTIPASFVTEQGVEYLVGADDKAGYSSNQAWKQVLVEYTNENSLTIPYSAGTAITNYRIISVPLDLAKNTVNDVFSDDLGALDKSKYRLFRYNGSSATELTSLSKIEIGNGYWFIAAESKTIDTGAGTTADTGSGKPTTMPVVNGWNQIGNPFNYDVSWARVTGALENDDKTLGALKTFTGTFTNSITLPKMAGAFLMVQDAGDGQLTIPYFKEEGRISAPEPVNFARTLDSDTWAVDFALKSGMTVNNFAGFGMHPKASEQNDGYDDFTLPRFMEYLELNYNKKLYGSNFTKDIIPTTGQHVWEFEVTSNLSDEVMELTWDNSFFGNSDKHLVLWDINQQRSIDMTLENRYVFERSLSGPFKVFFGDETFVKTESMPFRPVFHSASPVPSSGNVTLAFSVPETNSQVNTNLSIYNLMGQKVSNLLDQPLPGGYQQAIWNIEDGTKPAAGVYISVLKFGNSTLQKRLIVK
ncbi:MAG TPA: T9SS type A sorting domain-containing protein [Cyclobacteriaceae bacterium]|nr:T9SS type A sorting domain-containing protein [Cyclobacteriaceae bacterium]